MKLVLLLPRIYRCLNDVVQAVVEVFQALSGGGGWIKQGSKALVPVPVRPRARILRGDFRARSWRA